MKEDSMLAYGFWNNKGGTGKTSLCFQSLCLYAAQHPNERVLVIDACPQANLSELLLGGVANKGARNLLERQGELPRATLGGFFQMRLGFPYLVPRFTPESFLTRPHDYNPLIPENIDLICGDPLLELQVNALSTLANAQIPGTNTWLAVTDWLRDFLTPLRERYSTAFIDMNPSFSPYTQIALASVDRLVMPVMADDASRRAIHNAFSLVYGLGLPSETYASFSFGARMREARRALPQVHVVAQNRLPQYARPFSAYQAVLEAIESDVDALLASNPETFTFTNLKNGIVKIRDFQTTGSVAYTRGCPFSSLPLGRLDVLGQRININEENRDMCVAAMQALVDKL